MPNIPYKAINFKSRPPGHGGMINTSWAKFLWSAATVGQKKWRGLIQYRKCFSFEFAAKALRIHSYLRTKKDFIVKSPNYIRLDPTEKSHVEYDLGQRDAKLVAYKLFETPWLMHLNVYAKDFDVNFRSSKRPDLIGLTKSSNWIVIEAKGSGGKLPKSKLNYAKQQTQAISTINGNYPKLRAVVGSQFDKPGILEMVLMDPDDHLDEAPGIEIDPYIFLTSYYQPIITFFERDNINLIEGRFGNRNFQLASIPQANLQIGLDINLLDLLGQSQAGADEIVNYLIISTTTETSPIEIDGVPIEIGGDGIIVIPGPVWNEAYGYFDLLDKQE